MNTILVTAIGSFSADIVIKNLKGNNYKVIGCDINQKELLVDAYNVDKFYQSPLASQEKKYIEFLEKIIKENSINYIIPLTDYEVDVINKNRDIFNHLDCVICMSSYSTIKICRNKWSTYAYLKTSNYKNLIPTYKLSKIFKQKLQFPIVIKPLDGRSSQGLHYLYTIEELNGIIKTINIDDYIAQPLIKGTIVTVDLVRSSKENKVISIARKELLRTQNGAGTSIKIFKDKHFDDIVKNAADILNIEGCVNFEYIYDEISNSYYFIECNPRFSGGVEFSCIAGYDMIMNHLRIIDGQLIDKLPNYKEQYIARKYEEYVTCIDD